MHNLEKLMEMVKGKQLTVSSETESVVENLSNYHKEHWLRYEFDASVDLPAPARIWPALDELSSLTRIGGEEF